MQNVEPKDRPKLYALSGAAVVVFGIVIYITMKSIADVTPPHRDPVAAASTAPPAATGGATTTTPATGGAAANRGAAPTGSTVPAGTGTPATGFVVDINRPQGRDPFKVVPDDRLAKEAVRSSIFIPPPPLPTNVPATPILPTFTKGISKALGAMVDHKNSMESLWKDMNTAGNASVKPSITVEKAPPPPYAVLGVLIGEPGERDVAILHRTSGVDEKRYVVVGDVLDGGFKVVAIESEGVRVRTIGHDGQDELGTTFLKRQSDVPGTPVTIRLGATDSTPAK